MLCVCGHPLRRPFLPPLQAEEVGRGLLSLRVWPEIQPCVPGAVQHKRSVVMHRRTGTAKARVVTIPGLQRNTSCCAAPGKQARIFGQTCQDEVWLLLKTSW